MKRSVIVRIDVETDGSDPYKLDEAIVEAIASFDQTPLTFTMDEREVHVTNVTLVTSA